MTEDLIVLLVLAIIYGVNGLFALVGYLFKGFGMYRIARANNIPNGWLAFIPVASNYLQGELAGPVKLGKREFKRPGLWTLLVPILSGAVLSVFLVVMIAAVIIPAVIAEANGADPEAIMMTMFIVFYILFIVVAVVISALEQVVFGVARFYTHLRYNDTGKALVHMILGMMIPLYQPIYYFVLGRRQPKAETPETPETPEVVEAIPMEVPESETGEE